MELALDYTCRRKYGAVRGTVVIICTLAPFRRTTVIWCSTGWMPGRGIAAAVGCAGPNKDQMLVSCDTHNMRCTVQRVSGISCAAGTLLALSIRKLEMPY